MKKIYILLFVFLFSLSLPFTVFAADDPAEEYTILAGTYTLNSDAEFSTLAGQAEFALSFISDGQAFDGMWFRNSSTFGPCLCFSLAAPPSDHRGYYYIANASGFITDSGIYGGDFTVITVTDDTIVDSEFFLWFRANFTGDITADVGFNLFDTLYRIIVTYVFNNEGVDDNGILIDQMQHLVVTLVATLAWLFVVVIPFIIVYWLIMVITTGFRRF